IPGLRPGVCHDGRRASQDHLDDGLHCLPQWFPQQRDGAGVGDGCAALCHHLCVDPDPAAHHRRERVGPKGTGKMAVTTSTEPVVRRGESGFSWARVRLILSYVLLFLIALSFLYPFYLSVITSFRTLPAIAAEPVEVWPEEWTLDAYERMQRLNVPRWALNSALVAVVVTASNLF